MGARRSKTTLRRGLIITLNGVALWFLAVLANAYLSDPDPPWQSVTDFLVDAWTYTFAWLFTPRASVVASLAYLGIALVVSGPLWYGLRPLLPEELGDLVGETDVSRLPELPDEYTGQIATFGITAAVGLVFVSAIAVTMSVSGPVLPVGQSDNSPATWTTPRPTPTVTTSSPDGGGSASTDL